MAGLVKDPNDLLSLRNLMKRDPRAYHDELKQQLRHFEANLEICKLQQQGVATDSKKFEELISFLSHVAPFFKTEMRAFPDMLLGLLEHNFETLSPSLRRAVAQALILMCNRQLIDRLRILPTFFRLFRCRDKPLRKLLFAHIVQDIRRVNAKTQQNQLNSKLQNFMYQMLKDENGMAAKKSLDVMIELWRRKVWTDDKTVNAIATACFHKNTAILTSALRFFVGIEQIDDDDDDLDASEASQQYKELAISQASLKNAPRRKKRQRMIDRERKKLQDKESGNETAAQSRKRESGEARGFAAIELVYDPQSLAERLYAQLKGSSEAFAVRLLMMNVLARLIGIHKLLVFNYYPFLQKYIQPHQRHVTQILAYTAMACHELVDPDILKPVVATLASHFVTDRASPEVMAVGLNAIREICARAPLAMTAELLQDLVQYRKSKFKGVMMASRSLLALFREIGPALLHKTDRGKKASERMIDGLRAGGVSAAGMSDDEGDEMGVGAPLAYGQTRVYTDVVGADLLRQAEEDGLVQRGTEAEEWDMFTAADSDDEVDAEDVGLTLKDSDDDDDDGDDGEQEKDGDEDDGEDGESSSSSSSAATKKSKSSSSSAAASLSAAAEKKKKKQLPLGATRVLTPKDFERIALLQSRQRQRLGNKRHREDGSTLLNQNDTVHNTIDEDDIVGWVKKQKLSKEQRMASIYEGREDRDQFGAPKARGGGTTNEAKLKHKPFMLTKHSARLTYQKQRSFQERQSQEKAHKTGIKQMSKRMKTKIRRGKKA